MSVPTFIVGTGRCGSTMLSNMLREHPAILSLSEFFSMITDGDQSCEPFSPELMDGERFWSIVAAVGRFYTFFLRHGLAFPELLYPADGSESRFSSRTGVPGILLTALPHLTEEHDALFDQLGEEVHSWPPSMIGPHYRQLFDHLAERFGKRQWVERSGALLYAERLLSVFPDARFVHLVRDGRDTALSMQNHDAYRLGIIWLDIADALGVDPLASEDRTHLDRVPAELRPFLPESFNREAFRAYQVPLQTCAGHWSYQVEAGLKLLNGLPADRVLTLRYEDFFVAPKAQLDALAAFVGQDLVDEDWSTRCAGTIRQPRSSWRDLPGEIAQELTTACRPGFEQLRAAGVNYQL